MYKKNYHFSDIIHALSLYEQLKSLRKTAIKTGISKSTIHRWWHRLSSNFCRPKLRKYKRKRKRTKYPYIVEHIKDLFTSSSLQYYTLKNIRSALPYCEKQPSISYISKLLRLARVSRRRFTLTTLCPKNSLQMKELYQQFEKELNKYNDDEIVCIDETSFSNLGNEKYGYFNKGKTPEMANVLKRERYSVLMAVQPSGILQTEVFDQPVNKECFNSFMIRLLSNIKDNGIKAVLLDNVSFHHNKDFREWCKKYDISLLFIPPYSPRCNPIEQVFSIVKRYFRSFNDAVPFAIRIMRTFETVNLYKDIQHYYNHTRQHVGWYLEQK
jgi:transposase